jgi:hypothetical protein
MITATGAEKDGSRPDLLSDSSQGHHSKWPGGGGGKSEGGGRAGLGGTRREEVGCKYINKEDWDLAPVLLINLCVSLLYLRFPTYVLL